MNRNKIKGTIAERKVVNLLRAKGYQALRSPSSLSKTDILCNGIGTIQVKYMGKLRAFYDELWSITEDRRVIIQTPTGYAMYLENFLDKDTTGEVVSLSNTYSLHQLIQEQDYLIFASQYRPFMIFTLNLSNIMDFIQRK